MSEAQEVQRYRTVSFADGNVAPHPHPRGHWVKYTDYQQLREENERLRKLIAQAESREQFNSENVALEWSDRGGSWHPSQFWVAVMSCALDHYYDRTHDGVPDGMPDDYRAAFAPIVAGHLSAVNPDWESTTIYFESDDPRRSAFEEGLQRANQELYRKHWERKAQARSEAKVVPGEAHQWKYVPVSGTCWRCGSSSDVRQAVRGFAAWPEYGSEPLCEACRTASDTETYARTASSAVTMES